MMRLLILIVFVMVSTLGCEKGLNSKKGATTCPVHGDDAKKLANCIKFPQACNEFPWILAEGEYYKFQRRFVFIDGTVVVEVKILALLALRQLCR